MSAGWRSSALRKALPAVPLHNAVDHGEPNACTFKHFGRMQTLEDAEQPVGIAYIKARSVVPNRDYVIAILFIGARYDKRIFSSACKFEGVCQHIFKQNPHKHRIVLYGGQRAEQQTYHAERRLGVVETAEQNRFSSS